MPEYVYALHNFVPEKPDEVPFKVGDRIEVIEKDDLYQDGWWQGRNPQGQIGLFPQTYTSPNPPPPPPAVGFPGSSTGGVIQKADSTSSDISLMTPIALDTLTEEPESSTTNATATPDHDARERTLSQGNGEVMQATMTDVQRAIEQLGRNDRDGAQSFSFASSHGDYTDRSGTETEAESEDESGLGWHKGAREKLAMRAKRDNEERQAKEQAESAPSTPMRITAPPIDVEMSDDSEGEDDVEHLRMARESFASTRIRHISEDDEEEEEEEVPKTAAPIKSPLSGRASHHIEPSEDFIVPLPDESDLPTATATQATFPLPPSSEAIKAPSPVPASPTSTTPPPQKLASPPASPAPVLTVTDPAPTSVSAPTPSVVPVTEAVPAEAKPETPSSAQQAIYTPESLKSMPSTIRIGQQLPFASPAQESPTASTIGSVGPSGGSIQSTLTPATTATSIKTATPLTSPAPPKEASLHPSTKSVPKPAEWTVDDVVDWLKSKGMDQATCDKFIEQEISGDVLLELNQDVLKNEIGVTAFGKRVKIMNFINEIRRPPSPSESEKQAAAAASRAQSLKYSHSHTPSMGSSAQHSFHSGGPYYTGPQFSPVSSQMVTSPSAPPGTGMGNSYLVAENSPHASEFAAGGWRASDPGSIHAAALAEQQQQQTIGLGFGLPNSSSSPTVNMNGKSQKNRPSQLLLSPSDGALKASAIIDQRSPKRLEDRDVLSDSETTHVLDAKQKRRRLFGRSAESSSLNEKGSLKDNASRHSKDPTTPISASASPNDPKTSVFEDEQAPTRRTSRKRNSGERKASDRLSLFGSPFSGTIGKSRKPPPSTTGEEKPHLSTFSRIVGERRVGRPSTSDGTRSKDKSKEPNDRAILRKRTTSTAADTARPVVAPVPVSTLGPNLERGRSILEQIGTPDHNGWMRKKNDRYNSWKTRYFVLKGPHLYVLRSNDKSETKIKGYVNVTGYRVQADENIDPGRYGFQIIHDVDKTHYFSSDEIIVIREWMKAIMKATITRDYSNPVVSSSNIPTIPLTVAQAMNPAPRPPSPTARDATQRAHRRDNPNQLSSRDAEVLLMPMPGKDKSVNGHSERTRIDSFFTDDSASTQGKESTNKKTGSSSKSAPPPRPSREMRRTTHTEKESPDKSLVEWANSHLPEQLQVNDPTGPLFSGLALLRLAENIKGKPSSPPVPDSAFPSHPDDEKLDGLFRLFDYLLDNDVKMGSVSINDIRQGKRDKITQMLRALKTWEEKRKTIAQSIGKGSVASGPFMAMSGPVEYF